MLSRFAGGMPEPNLLEPEDDWAAGGAGAKVEERDEVGRGGC